MRAKYLSTQRGLVVLAISTAVALGFSVAAHAEAVPSLIASISVSTSQVLPGGSVQITASFVPGADAGPVSVGIDLLGAGADTELSVTLSTAELSGCSVAVHAVSCAWDEQAAHGAQTLVVEVVVGTNAGAGSWTARALAGIAGTPPVSVAETAVTVVAPPAPATTQPAVTTTTIVETTTTAPAPTTQPPMATLAPATTIAQIVPPIEIEATTSSVRTTLSPAVTSDALPTTGTDSDRSLRFALASLIGGVGLVMLARRERPAAKR